MNNPFLTIDARLTNIESLLLSLKHETIPNLSKSQETESDPDQLLTKKEAATLLRCATSTIDNWRRIGKIKRYYVGSSVRFKKNELLAAVNQM